MFCLCRYPQVKPPNSEGRRPRCFGGVWEKGVFPMIVGGASDYMLNTMNYVIA